MGSTRQIFSEDTLGAGVLLPTNTKIHLMVKSDRIHTNKKRYLDNLEISYNYFLRINIKHKTMENQKSDETLEDICVSFFLQLFLISPQQNLSVVDFKTNSIIILTTQSSQTILSCPPGKMDQPAIFIGLFLKYKS